MATVDKSLNVLLSLADNNGQAHNTNTGQPLYSNRELLESFWLRCRLNNLRARTMKCYADRLSYLVSYCNNRSLDLGSISRHDIERYILNIVDTVAAETVNGRIRVYKAFFNYLNTEQLVDSNPTEGIKLLRVEETIKPVLAAKQIEMLLNSFNPRTFAGTRNRLAALTMLDGCLRVGELVNVKTEECQLDDRLLVIKGKSRRERLVPISPRTARSIHSFLLRFRSKLPGDRLICYRNGDEMDPTRFNKIFAYAGQKLGFRVYPHMLRRTGATHLARSGASIEMVRRLLGHTDIRCTMKYVNYGVDDLQRIHDKHNLVGALNLT